MNDRSDPAIAETDDARARLPQYRRTNMSLATQQAIWFANEKMALRPNLPRVMALEPVELRKLMDCELSDQQKRVILLLSEGYANKHIAWVLGVEEATAKAHVSSILKKFGCTNRTQAALLGLRVRLYAAEGAPSHVSCTHQDASAAAGDARHCI